MTTSNNQPPATGVWLSFRMSCLAVLILVAASQAPGLLANQPKQAKKDLCLTLAEERTPPPPDICSQMHGPAVNMLVMGDSIMWGEGLLENHKFSYLVQEWLCSSLQRNVVLYRVAHSGATLEKIEGLCPNLHGEIDVSRPSVREQLADARLHYEKSGVPVDIVLMDGCYNDISQNRLVNHRLSYEYIRNRARDACYGSMKPVLSEVARTFPNSAIIVTGYYPIVTDKSAKNFAMRGIFSAVFASEFLGWLLPTSKQKIFGDLVPRSRLWADESNQALELSTEEANKEDTSTVGKRIAFAKISDYFGAGSGLSAPRKTTLLWTVNFNSTGRRFLNKGRYVLFHFGTIFETNDELRKCRDEICNPTESCPEFKKFICHRAAMAHPNLDGAAVYAHAIEKELKDLLKSQIRRTVELTPIKVPEPTTTGSVDPASIRQQDD